MIHCWKKRNCKCWKNSDNLLTYQICSISEILKYVSTHYWLKSAIKILFVSCKDHPNFNFLTIFEETSLLMSEWVRALSLAFMRYHQPSGPQLVECGIPLGSILGPLLFLHYRVTLKQENVTENNQEYQCVKNYEFLIA